jgi:hypothetical protein
MMYPRRHAVGTSGSGTEISSDTLVNIRQITRRHIPEDGNLHSHHCENFEIY